MTFLVLEVDMIALHVKIACQWPWQCFAKIFGRTDGPWISRAFVFSSVSGVSVFLNV